MLGKLPTTNTLISDLLDRKDHHLCMTFELPSSEVRDILSSCDQAYLTPQEYKELLTKCHDKARSYLKNEKN